MELRLQRPFFEQNTVVVARELLGKILVRKENDGQSYKGMIVETEAYLGMNDDASHFSRGLTERTKVIEETGGHIYIYHIYGMYQCFNIVTEVKGVHGAVLIRAVEPLEGIERMYGHRYQKPYEQTIPLKERKNLTNGPAKLCLAFQLTKDEFYGRDLANDPQIWIEEGRPIPTADIVRTTRINIDYAEKGKAYLLRFYIHNHPDVSRR